MSGITGLDYGAIEAMLRMQKKTIRPAVFEGIQIMERAALSALALRQG